MRPAALHLTLVFVGSVTPTQVDQLERIAGGVRGEAFDLRVDRLGFWPQRGILWAGCSQPPALLRRLAESLAGALRAAGLVIDQHSGSALVPHITLARRVHCASLPQLETSIQWRVSEFSLVETHLHPSAATYKVLASFPLNAVDPGDG